LLFLSISEGPDGNHTRPIVATTDPQIITEVVRALTRRLGREERTPARLRGLPRGGAPDDGGTVP
jgi:hypothetical protein